MYDVFSIRGKKLEPERACDSPFRVCTCSERSKHFIGNMMNLVLLFLIEVSRTLACQKDFLLVVRTLMVKSQSIFLRTRTFRPDNAVELDHHQNRTKRSSRANCQRWGALVCIDHFPIFCKDYSHLWNTSPQ